MRRWLGFTAALVGLSLLGVVINAALAFTVSMGRAICGHGDSGFVCTTAGEQLGIWVPWAAWVIAIVLSLILGRSAIRAGRSPFSSLWSGAAAYAVGFAVAYSIAVS